MDGYLRFISLDGVIEECRDDDMDGVFGRNDAFARVQFEDGIRAQHPRGERGIDQRFVAQLDFLL